jgi:hypothetical protein
LPSGVSTVFGVALTLCAVIVLLLSLQRHRTVGAGIERNEYGWSPRLAIALTLVLAAAGALLAVYLIITALTQPCAARNLPVQHCFDIASMRRFLL